MTRHFNINQRGAYNPALKLKKMKQTIFNIAQDYYKLMDELEQSEGVMSDEQAQALEINEQQRDGKAIAYLEVIKGAEARVEVAKEEIKRLQAYVKRNERLIDVLKERLVWAVNMFGEFTVGTLSFGIRKSQSVVIDDEAAIGAEYKNSKVVETIDKKAIKEAIDSGLEVAGAHISENQNLKIK